MRAAMVGGGAYLAGKKVQQGRQQGADQEAAAPPADPAPPTAGTSDMLEQLKQLGELRIEGVLTDAEFDEQKQKVLQST
jgi:hypothetical protein